MEFKEYLAIIRRRWLLFFPIFALIMGAHLIWINYGQQEQVAAVSKVIITESKSSSSHEDLMSLGAISPTTKEATLKDYPVLRQAAELALGIDEFTSPEFETPKIKPRLEEAVQGLRGRVGSDEAAIEQLVRRLQRQARVAHQDNRQIVEIRVEDVNESDALLLSWSVAEGAHQYHESKAHQEVEAFIVKLDSQLDIAEQELSDAFESYREVQDRVGISNFPEMERLFVENVMRTERKIDELKAEIQKNNRIIKHRLQRQAVGRRRDIGGAPRASKQTDQLIRLENMLWEKKLALETKSAVLARNHPKITELRNSILALEKQVVAEESNAIVAQQAKHAEHTEQLINENAQLSLEIEVYDDRKKYLNDELYRLNRVRQDIVPMHENYKEAQQRLASLNTSLKHAHFLADKQLGNVSVYDPAIMVEFMTMTGTGFGPLSLTMLMAFIFALGVVYIVEYVDTRVKSEHDVRRHLNLPLLGIIPKENNYGGLLTDAPPQSEISEKFNTAATLIQSTASDLNLRAIMVCSAIAREGKTTVSVNLAVALARKGSRVILVDGDLRLSQVHNVLRLPNNTGLATALDPAIDPSQIIDGVMTDEDMSGGPSSVLSKVQRTHLECLDVLTSGPPTSDPVALLDSSRLARIVGELKQHYDFVIFDTPPINKVGDALTISSCMDGCVFVVGSGQAEQHDVTWAKHLLANVQANILGVFLNKFAKQGGSEYYYYYYDNDRKRKRVRSRA